MKVKRNIIILISIAVHLPATGENSDYIQARSMSWEQYHSLQTKAHNIKEVDQDAYKVCLSFVEKANYSFFDDAAIFCKLSRSYKDWVWFELPSGGSVYCGSLFAVSLEEKKPSVYFTTNTCGSDYSITIFDETKDRMLNDGSLLLIDGQLFMYSYKTFQDKLLFQSLGNSTQSVQLLYADNKKIGTRDVSINGSSAAMRFMGFVD
ncbi:hypothetical protein P3553_23095 [Vibrio parahaemolyticus]|uniref:hypothetical protein n=1 Tax=Vibrio harveyi group TaxID=717610 RepID=UPI0011DD4FAE|nr:hypothetical protein [Vibrio parahaemolyticus]EGQ8127140.1 hypothetical protein [Vibrio parahaemolyticus]EIN4363381.1 hypothetical protein [Vibrio parahaemolyticus]MDF4796950.1 hypothetical protein [Vibrio parahaemolyticus]MDF5408115.1 hypothetical protein [Vibrio parahaemolyticus]MDG2687282.1 hypothetical protein [Vibrio parahaemolyticus]